MRRWAGCALLGFVLVAVACQPAPPPPPPPGWVPPEIDSLVVAPEVLAGGSTFTVSVTASDDEQVRFVSLVFGRPNDGGGMSQIDCQLPGAERSGTVFRLAAPQPAIAVEFTCTVSPVANGGTWTVTASAMDRAGFVPGQTLSTAADLEVTGGSDDYDPPVLESVSLSPDPIITGSWFTVTVTVSDDNLDPVTIEPSMGYVGTHINSYGRPCYTPTVTRLSATSQRMAFSCQANSDGLYGTYRASFSVYDALGNALSHTFDFQMVPKP